MQLSKTKSSFYRRLLIAALIDKGINTLPLIMAEIDIPRRTTQDTINALEELDIDCRFEGATKNGHYKIHSWGAIDKAWLEANFLKIKTTLNY